MKTNERKKHTSWLRLKIMRRQRFISSMNANKKSPSWLRPEVIIAILSLIATIMLALPPAITAFDELLTKDAPPKIIITLDKYYDEGRTEKVFMIWDISATSNRFWVNDSQTIIKVDGENGSFYGGLSSPFLYKTIKSGIYDRDGEIGIPSGKKVGGHEISIDFWMRIEDLKTGKIYEGNMERPYVFIAENWDSLIKPRRIVLSPTS